MRFFQRLSGIHFYTPKTLKLERRSWVGRLLKVFPPHLGKTGDVFKVCGRRNPWLWSCNVCKKTAKHGEFPTTTTQKIRGLQLCNPRRFVRRQRTGESRVPSRPGFRLPGERIEVRGDAVASSLGRSPEGRIRVGASQPREAPPPQPRFLHQAWGFLFFLMGRERRSWPICSL